MFKISLKIFFSSLLAILAFSAVAAAEIKNISPVDMHNRIISSPNFYLLDVRTLGEYVQKRIKSAHLIPIDQVQRRINEIPKDRPIIVYCETGMRSTQVAKYLESLGYKDVSNLSQGIMGWQVRGYPVESGMP